MLSKVFEWSRVIHPVPDDDFVAKRTAVVSALVAAFSSNVDRLIDCACVASIGVMPRFSQQSEIVSHVIAAIRKEQPATPESLLENQLNIRTCCSLVVGELASRVNEKNGISAESEMMLAIISAALANKPLPPQRHMREMLSELLAVCRRAFNHASEYRHQRFALGHSINEIQEAADVPAFWKGAKPQLLALVDAIEQNEAVDREELDTLWWAFNGASSATDRPFAEMRAGEAALRSAHELSELIVVPPLPNTRFLLRRVLTTGRPAEDLDGRGLREQISEWGNAAADQFLPKGDKVADLVRNNPAVFPVSWACQRTVDGATNLSEMKKITLWDPAAKVRPETLAFQAFEERIAQRLYQTFVE
jgi:hypothetical protein